jgi:hypothetical protein
MRNPLQRGNRARIGFGAAGLLAVGLFKNSFPLIARAVSGVATAKITGYWRNPVGVKFGQCHVAGQSVSDALVGDRNRGAAFYFFSPP